MAVPTDDTVALQTGMEAIKAMAMEDGEGDGLVAAGGVAAVVGGMQAHVGVADLQQEGISALGHIACNSDAAEAVVAAGGVAAVVGGMQAHVGVELVQERGNLALQSMKGSCIGCGNVKELDAFCQSQLIKEPGNWECKACTGDSAGVPGLPIYSSDYPWCAIMVMPRPL